MLPFSLHILSTYNINNEATEVNPCIYIKNRFIFTAHHRMNLDVLPPIVYAWERSQYNANCLKCGGID